MNKTKRALISMTVIAAVFCLSLIINAKSFLVPGQKNNLSSNLASSSEVIDAPVNSDDHSSIHSLLFLQLPESLKRTGYAASQSSKILPSAPSNDASREYLAAALVNASGANAALSTYPTAGQPTDGGTEANDKIELNKSIDTETAIVITATSNTGTNKALADSSASASATDSESEDSISLLSENGSMQELETEAQYANIGISNAKDFVYIRKDPSTDGEILGKLYRDSAATILRPEGDWYYVESGSVTGYIKAEFLTTGLSDAELIADYSTQSISVAVDGLNVREDKSQDAKRLTVIYQNEIYPVIKVEDDWILIKLEDEHLQGYVLQEYSELIVKFKEAISKEEEEKELQLQAEAKAKEETAVKQSEAVDYASSDLKLLACLVHAEAGTQSYEGKLAVANVVLNRIKSSKYPDTLKAVIYQSGQFTVAASGSLDKQLNNYSNYSSTSQLMSIKAAKTALQGANNIGSRLYFNSYKTALRKGYTEYESSVKLGDHLFW
ncbi:MAG: hypothetical protein K0S04_3218 [Herbinix sp.]|jgi:spore germination cell wall hydrolase CwlJ-like protein|nr:hypothetical protein [Herbinix sp.]